MKLSTAVCFALLAATPAFAQTGANPPDIREPGPAVVTTPGQPPEAVFQGSRTPIDMDGPGSTGTLARSGTGADNWTNNSAETLNSTDPERAIPNVGGGGGGDGGGGQ